MMNNHSTSNVILECQNLSYKFERNLVFENLNLDVFASESLSVTGINGSGKTTLLKILAGILKPTSGDMRCFNESIWPSKKTSSEHKSIYLSYEPAFYFDLSVIQNVKFFLKLYNENIALEEIQSTLKNVGLSHKTQIIVRELSSGQKRRLTLGILSLLKPRIVFADEPTNGLDAEGIKLCVRIFEDLMKNQKTSFVIATHDPDIINWSQKTLNLDNHKPISKNLKLKDFKAAYLF